MINRACRQIPKFGDVCVFVLLIFGRHLPVNQMNKNPNIAKLTKLGVSTGSGDKVGRDGNSDDQVKMGHM